MATVEITVEQLEAHGYFFRRYPSTDQRHYGADEWGWGVGSTLAADGYSSLDDAVTDAAEDYTQQDGAR